MKGVRTLLAMRPEWYLQFWICSSGRGCLGGVLGCLLRMPLNIAGDVSEV